MFVIGYLLNEAPTTFRFALLSETVDLLVLSKKTVKFVTIPVTENLYGLLDVVKDFYDQTVYGDRSVDIYGVFISRPSQERLFEVQIAVNQRTDAIKSSIQALLRKYNMPTKLETHYEEFGRLRDILKQTELPVRKPSFSVDVDNESSAIVEPSFEPSKRSWKRVHIADDRRMSSKEISPQPSNLKGLLPAIDPLALTVSDVNDQPTQKESIYFPSRSRSLDADLPALPGIKTSRSSDEVALLDSSPEMLSKITREVVKRRATAPPGVPALNIHLGRKVAWTQRNSHYNPVDSSSSGSTD